MLLIFLNLACSADENPQQNLLITHQLTVQAGRTPGAVLNANKFKLFYEKCKGNFLAAAELVGTSMGEGLKQGISYGN